MKFPKKIAYRIIVILLVLVLLISIYIWMFIPLKFKNIDTYVGKQMVFHGKLITEDNSTFLIEGISEERILLEKINWKECQGNSINIIGSVCPQNVSKEYVLVRGKLTKEEGYKIQIAYVTKTIKLTNPINVLIKAKQKFLWLFFHDITYYGNHYDITLYNPFFKTKIVNVWPINGSIQSTREPYPIIMD